MAVFRDTKRAQEVKAPTRYRCPDCQRIFRHPAENPPPDRCPLCHAWVSEDEPPEEVFVPQSPAIQKLAFNKSVKQVYRAVEESSIQRAKDAADMAGVPESEMAHLKVTNMRDPSEMRQGDMAAIMPSPSVAAQSLTVGASAPGFQQFGGAVPNHAPGVGGYEERNAVVSGISTTHVSRAAAMTRAGNLGSYKE